MPRDVRSISTSVCLSVTDDGALVHSSNPDKFVKKKEGEFLEALTETGISILEKYELNIEQELILRRNGASLSRLKSLFNSDDVKSAIRYFSGAIKQATDLNRGAVDNIRNGFLIVAPGMQSM